MSVVVSDASPLINLARVDQFELLAAFYGQIVIPQAVYEEVVVRGFEGAWHTGNPGACQTGRTNFQLETGARSVACARHLD